MLHYLLVIQVVVYCYSFRIANSALEYPSTGFRTSQLTKAVVIHLNESE